jgi:hypothetical protein
MVRSHRGAAVVRRWAAVPLLAAAALGCRGPAKAAGEVPRRYSVRGEVVQLPDSRRPGSELLVRHEAIDDFVNRAGDMVGMDAMVMPFPVEAPLSAAGLSLGDKVEVGFAVDWERSRLVVERLERLPADTPLSFERARPGRARAGR